LLQQRVARHLEAAERDNDDDRHGHRHFDQNHGAAVGDEPAPTVHEVGGNHQ